MSAITAGEIILAHGAGGGADELFVMAGLGLAILGGLRAFDKDRPTPRRMIGLPLIAVGLFAAASPFVFRFGGPQQAKIRIPSQATLEIINPVPGEEISGSFAPVRVRLVGGKIVNQLTTDLATDDGSFRPPVRAQVPFIVDP